jgi:hypothetical protein
MKSSSTVWRIGIILVFVTVAGPASADSVLVNETLLQPCAAADCAVSGGAFTPDGWEVAGPDDRITVTLPERVDSGIAEIDITKFDPPNNGRQGTASENYCVIFSGFEGTHFDHHSAPQFSESFFEIISVWCDYEGGDETNCDSYSFREHGLKIGATGSGGGESAAWLSTGGSDTEFAWDMSVTYHLTIEWDLSEVRFTAYEDKPGGTNGSVTRVWYFTPEKPAPGLSHMLIAQNDSPCDPIMQATYSNLKVTKRDVEIPDGGTADAGPDDAGQPDTGGGDTGAADAGVLDGGIKDAAAGDVGPGDTGHPEAGGGPDTGAEEDAATIEDSGAADDAGNERASPSEAAEGGEGGCGCATLRVP